MLAVPVSSAPVLTLTEEDRERLEALIRAGSTPQAFVFRARVVLRVAAPDEPTNLQVAAELKCNRHTVALWRERYLQQGLAGLLDAPRSGRPRRFSPLGTC
jgi:hypothetical protein